MKTHGIPKKIDFIFQFYIEKYQPKIKKYIFDTGYHKNTISPFFVLSESIRKRFLVDMFSTLGTLSQWDKI